MCRIEYVNKENRKSQPSMDSEDFDIKRMPTLSKSENKKDSKGGNQPIALISVNERDALNDNLFDEKVLDIQKRDLDRCLNISLAQIKREKEVLTKKYLDYQANNHSLLKKRKEEIRKRSSISLEPQQISTETLNTTNSSFNLKYTSQAPPVKVTSSSAVNFDTSRTANTMEESLLDFENKHSRYIKSAPSRMFNMKPEPFDEFKLDQIDLISRFESVYETQYENLPERLKLKTPNQYNSFLDTIKDKFVEQKLTMFPNYLKPCKRPNKMTKSLHDFELEMGNFQFENFN
jgi:hypothetical protein